MPCRVIFMMTQRPLTDQPIYPVSDFVRLTREIIEQHFSHVWLIGEISNFSRPQSGHWYFSLKDGSAQIRCAMFRSSNQQIRFQPQDGMHVLVCAKASIYEARGEFQLIVSYLEEQGTGALQRAFEQLKEKLFKEGLFDERYKKPIPRYPQRIGVVTSKTGAAIQDVLSVLKRRAPYVDIMIYPTLVQGAQASDQIIHAIEVANEHAECDVLLLVRGGGSLEDLWSFNKERVARAIFKSQIPIVTGIGHEVDFTIADFVADYRAPTPSAAAEMVSPDKNKLLEQLKQYEKRLIFAMKNHLSDHQKSIVWLQKRLQQAHPLRQIQAQSQRIDHLLVRIVSAQHRLLEEKKSQVQSLARSLHAMSPLATLDRGYSILMSKEGQVITDVKAVEVGDFVMAKLSVGQLGCRVEEKAEN